MVCIRLKTYGVSMHIPEDVLQRVLEAANIREVIGEYVSLKKRGRSWIGLCPFHPDKNPSFSVNEEKQLFYCFGCGEGGNVLKFLMKIQGINFVEAVKVLANRYGIPIPERPQSSREQEQRREREELISLNLEASEFYHQNLLHSKDATEARAYLKGRGLSAEIISRFHLGWAYDRWDGLVNYLKSKKLSLDMAEKAGLLISKKKGIGYYDRFRGRIIFPIANRSGKIVALGGRIMGEGHPKYLNSSESPVYHKGRLLYGLYQNKAAISHKGMGYVVEGYMDFLALAQYEIDQAVATLGTALTEDHVKQLKGLCKDWVLVFDGDAAGIKAALRALPLFYKVNLRVKVLTLNPEDDPDTFVRREGKEAWEILVDKACPGLDFAMQRGLASYGKDPEGRLKTIEDALLIVQPINDPVRKSLLLGHVAQRLGVREDSLWKRLNSNTANVRKDPVQVQRPEPKVLKGTKNCADAKLIGFLLKYPEDVGIFMDLGLDLWLKDPSLKGLWMAMSHLYSMTGRLESSALENQLESTPNLRALAMQLLADFPGCEDREEMLLALKSYSEDCRNRVLRWGILEQMKTSHKEVDDEKLLRQFLQFR